MRGLGALLLVLGLMLAGDDAEAKPKPKPRPDPPRPPEPKPEPPPDIEPEPEPEPEPDQGDADEYKPKPGAEPLWMLPGNAGKVRAHSFGQRRPFSGGDPKTHHAGTDIKARAGDAVVMPEDGTVIRNAGWSGPKAKATYVQLDSGPVIIFGAVDPNTMPARGARLLRGELVGRIGTYPKGGQMLHLEQWTVGMWQDKPRPKGPWKWNKPRPDGLVDPTAYLKSMIR